ncbi:MAG: hypothetical protein ACI97K_002568 [Glaciecola sp.]|jgi:hypothetical protein
MKKRSIMCTLFVSTALLSGCSTMGPGTKVEQVVERNGVDMALIPATYREVYFSPSVSKEKYCRAPDPDFSVQQSDQLNLSLPMNGGESIGGGEKQTGLNLGGRSPAVLITRELMYRACELASNINADDKTTIDIYSAFLEGIKDIVQQSSLTGTTNSDITSSSTSSEDSSSNEDDDLEGGN